MLIVHYKKKLHLENQIETNNEWILNKKSNSYI